MSRKLKAVIVDDERLARNVLKSHLNEFPEIEITGEAKNVATAIKVITENKPEVVFLDIQMPGETGFDLLEKVKTDFHIIFITAHDEHAIRAFEVNALDYLLKPIKKTRLRNSINRLTEHLKVQRKIITADYNDRLMLKVDGYVKLVSIKNIIKITADKDYSCVTLCDGKEMRLLKTLKEWENKLPSEFFGRIHRSAIINYDYIDKIEKVSGQSYKIYIKNINDPVIMSRRFGAPLKSRLKF